ncbi:MAG: hypothetical protein ACI35S_01475 [Anaeroplasma sp.]
MNEDIVEQDFSIFEENEYESKADDYAKFLAQMIEKYKSALLEN